MNWLSMQWNNVTESSFGTEKKEPNILRFDFLTFANMKIRENGVRSFDNSAVRKQYSAKEISADDFSAIRWDLQFIYRPNFMYSC